MHCQLKLLTKAITAALGWRGLIASFPMRRAKEIRLALLCTLSVISLGCTELVEVVGQVTYQGEPIKQGTIQFRPESGRAISSLITDGLFEIEPNKITPGEYQVRVYSQKETGRKIPSPDGWMEKSPASAPEFVQVLPEKYNLKTALSATIVVGQNKLDFLLE